jgi:DNA helicase-2/ATP-dependent DNA helicase PcrA
LDADQRAFCELDNVPVRVLAPAGSGKTETLLWRCKTLADRSSGGSARFLVLTFTRAARDELRERLRTVEELRAVEPRVTITTLNSWGFRFLKRNTSYCRLITSRKEMYGLCVNALRPIWRRYPRIREVMEDQRIKNRAAVELLEISGFLKAMGLRHDRCTAREQFIQGLDQLRQYRMIKQVRNFFERLSDLDIIRSSVGSVRSLSDDETFHTLASEAHEHFVGFWSESTEWMARASYFTLEDQKYWPRVFLENALARVSSFGKVLTL